MNNFIINIGRILINLIVLFGRFITFFAMSIKSIFGQFRVVFLLNNLSNIIISMAPIMALTSISTGAVITLQMYNGFSRFNVENSIPIVISLSLARELAPIMSTVILISRFITSLASEIAYMKISQQIDALKVSSIDPMNFLFSHRIIAVIISMPFLFTFFYLIGLFGGYIVSVFLLDFSGYEYINQAIDALQNDDIECGLIKSLCFGFISVVIACYNGFFCGDGVKGVSRAVINSVVFSIISMFILNYILTALLF